MKNYTLLCLSLLVYSCTNGNSQQLFKYEKAQKSGVAAKFGDVEITEKELSKGIESEVYETEMRLFQLKEERLKNIALEKVIAQENKGSQISVDEYIEKNIVKNISISDSEMNKFMKEKNIPKEHLTEELRVRIKNFLMLEKKKEIVDEWLLKKTKSTPIVAYFEKPSRPTFDVQVGTSPFKGKADAKVTIVEFSDFQCPYCSNATAILKEVAKAYPKDVRIVFKNFPLPFHTQAEGAALAALCANDQNPEAFWKMHDMMFENQNKLDVETLKENAKKIGLKADAFNECLSSEKLKSLIEADKKQGGELGIKSTPTIFVNGKLVQGAQDIAVFKEIIDAELK
jgi:protein-disulfide isomerase